MPDKGRARDGSKMRSAILALIEATPGIHMSAIRRRLDIGWGTVTHHVRVLRAGGEVQTYSAGREARVFPAGIPHDHVRWLSALRDGVDRAIVQALRGGESGLRVSELESRVGHSRKILRRHLVRLGEDGVVAKRGQRRPQYAMRPEFLSFLGRGMAAQALRDEADGPGQGQDPGIGYP